MSNHNLPDYEGHPRSKQIRAICLEAIKGNDVSLSDVYQCLADLNVRPRMNTGLPQEEYKDPITAAEFVAGQLMPTLVESTSLRQSLAHQHLLRMLSDMLG